MNRLPRDRPARVADGGATTTSLTPPLVGDLHLVGHQLPVPLVTGEEVPYLNLDYAASTPPLVRVAEAVQAFLPWYSSVHRGAGHKSQVATAAYEGARERVHRFLGLRADDQVLFVRNTTDAINLLASALPDGCQVITFAVEHHANLLPWRRPGLSARHLPVPATPGDALEQLDSALRDRPAGPCLVAVTGASNVTGEIWPIGELAEVAHRHGARILLDAAQLAPHHPIDVAGLEVDFVAFSGHKIYAPFGAGVLAGRGDWLRAPVPYLRGGGAVEFVTLDTVLWSDLPDRQEAGSPNVVGAVALGAACEALSGYGIERLAAEEMALARYARERIGAVEDVELYRLWPETHPRLAIATFNVRGLWHSQLAAILSAEYGIGVRHGCFCAHPLILSLLHVGTTEAERIRTEISDGAKGRVPGAVRASMGLGTTRDDVDALAAALDSIVKWGPRWTYRLDAATGEYVPDPETRPMPALPIALAPVGARGGESS